MEVEDSFNYEMEDDNDNTDDENNLDDSQDSDQPQTQSTQQASQQPPETNDSHIWGYLQPCTSGVTRIDFWKIHPRYTIGRNTEANQVVLPGFKVSNQHCVITWDGKDSVDALVVVEDKSSNGTFINNEKIGRGLTRILREGNEIAFGTVVPQLQNGGLEDYRFVYRHTAGGRPTDGLFGQYDLGIELGKGSFATVRKAIHKPTGKWYAVKMIYPNKSVGQKESHNQNLTREISIMEKLHHRNICKLIEVFFQDDDSIHLVLELVEGGDLLDYIIRNGGLGEIDARDITYQMCNALAYIHSRGVAHRDLKPENVLLTSHRPPIVKIADFGLAKVIEGLTMLRTMCGTPSYLAPEVVLQEDKGGYNNLVDSWSVGVIVFAMLSNSSPFPDAKTQKGTDVREHILTRKILWELLFDRGPSDEAVNFVHTLLQFYPATRMSMAQALEHPWLLNHIPFHPPDFDEFQTSGGGDDSRMSSNRTNFGSFGDSLDGGHGGSPTSTLRRRKDVIAEADEGRVLLPEPSSEMVSNVAQQGPSTAAAAATTTTTSSRGQNKRGLSTLPEDSLEQVYAAADAARNASSDVIPGSSSDPQNPDGARRSARRKKVPRRG